jgi:tetratricopeptide (TPR) repeat protein
MKNIYEIDINIRSLETDNQFEVTWEHKASYDRESFEESAAGVLEYLKDEMEDMWQHSLENRLELGRRLFNFLDGPNRLLEIALDKADKYGKTLLLNLRKLDGCEDWPFELLAKDNVFLLPQQKVHLVRRLSDRGEKTRYTPKKRRLKMLFMCCAPLDYEPQLDFHQEEEKILRETDRLAIDIDVEDSGTLAGLRKKLRQNEYDVIHLSDHAGIDKYNEPFFVTENESGDHLLVSPRELWDEALMDNSPRLLFLSGCRTGQVQQKLSLGSFAHRMVKNHNIPVVLGWSHRVDDVSATYAEAVFYQYLSLGKSILDALWLTRYKLENPPDNDIQENSACIWPQLRLFCDGTKLNALVAEYQGMQPEKELDVILRDKDLPNVKEGFVGRRRQLQQGVKAIKDPGDHIGALILGLVGLGKSSLAAKICQHCTGYHTIPIKGKLDAFSLTEALEEAFRWNRDQKGERILKSRKDMRDKMAELCQHSFRDKNYLLLLDDFHENLEGWDKGSPGALLPKAADLLTTLLQYLPLSGKMSQMIITSRFGFSLQEKGSDLVKKRLKTIPVTSFQGPEQRKMAHKLAQGFDIPYYQWFLRLTAMGYGNPVLINEIAGLVKDKKTIEIQQLQIGAAEIRKEFIRQHRLKELLANIEEELLRFLRRLSIFRRPIPVEGILQLVKDAGLGEWKALLVRGIELGLIEHFQSHGTYRLTPLLREELLPEAEKDHPYHQSACNYYRSYAHQKEYIEPEALEELIYHALGCGQEQNVAQWGAILVKHLRDEKLQFHGARDKGIWIISELEKKNALSTEYGPSLVNETAVTMKRLNEFNEAVKYFKKAYDINLELKGEMHEAAAGYLNNLAAVWSALGNHRKAAACFRKVLRIVRQTCGRDSLETATALNNLGTAMSAGGKHGKAVENIKKALKIIKVKPDTECKEFAVTLNNLGEAWEAQEQYKKAEVCYRKAYDIAGKLYREPHPSIATCLNNLGSLQAAKGQYEKAVGYYRKALRMFDLCYGPFHLDVASALSNLGDVHSYQGKKKAAKENYRKALDIFRDVAPGHSYIRELEEKLKNLADLK